MDWILRIAPRGLLAVFAMMLASGWAGELSAAEPSDWPCSRPTDPVAEVISRDHAGAKSVAEQPVQEAARTDEPTKAVDLWASPLVAARPLKKRSEQLERIAQQADRRTQYGYELAGRNAYFAARSEFIGALRLVAEGLDTERKAVVHSRALAAAIRAMKEAEDFLPSQSRAEVALDLPGIFATHTTPVLKDRAEDMTSLAALRCYHTFSQEQFAAAAGHEVAGSMALHALGKLHAALARKNGSPIVAPESKAMVFYQAALLAYSENSLAANDLGVLLARCGRSNDARAMLEHGLALHPQSTGWRNLVVVYGQLGQTALAERAVRQAERLRRQELARRQKSPASVTGAVQWVDPQTFAQSSTSPLNPRDIAPMMPAVKPHVANTPVAKPQAAGRAAPNVVWPAPTPAAASRMSRGASIYKR